jgi:hypothetical protein
MAYNFVEQEILGLEVAVEHALLVAERYAPQELVEEYTHVVHVLPWRKFNT